MQFVVGLGQGTLRLLQFSGQLALETEATKDYRHWQDVIKDYFTHRAMMKITLWKDGQKQEAKPFEIGTPILPRFFLVTAQSGVKSMSIVLDNAREKTIAPGHGIIECPTASWIFRYSNGYTVALNGPLSAHVAAVPLMSPGQPPTPMSYVLRIEHLTFDATSHEKMVNVDRVGNLSIDGSPSHHALAMGPMGTKREEEEKRLDDVRRVSVAMPHEPVNAFGIPQATMRCLELAESVSQMSDLIHYSTEHQLGPRDALSHLARQIRDSQPRDVKPMIMSKPGPPPGPGPGSMFDGAGSSSTSLSSTMNQATAPSTPHIAPAAVDSKQNKPAMQVSSQPSSSTPSASASTPAAAATPGGPTTTPSMPNATLKRKATRTEDGSPIVANADQAPPAKRTTRKRGRTQGG